MTQLTFIEQCRQKIILNPEETIKQYIDLYYSYPEDGVPLCNFLGMTETQYYLWVRFPYTLLFIIHYPELFDVINNKLHQLKYMEEYQIVKFDRSKLVIKVMVREHGLIDREKLLELEDLVRDQYLIDLEIKVWANQGR